jgi:hypothetical protein
MTQKNRDFLPIVTHMSQRSKSVLSGNDVNTDHSGSSAEKPGIEDAHRWARGKRSLYHRPDFFIGTQVIPLICLGGSRQVGSFRCVVLGEAIASCLPPQQEKRATGPTPVLLLHAFASSYLVMS